MSNRTKISQDENSFQWRRSIISGVVGSIVATLVIAIAGQFRGEWIIDLLGGVTQAELQFEINQLVNQIEDQITLQTEQTAYSSISDDKLHNIQRRIEIIENHLQNDTEASGIHNIEQSTQFLESLPVPPIQVAIDSEIRGSITSAVPEAPYLVILEAGVEYIIDMEGRNTNKGTLRDTVLRIYDDNGNEHMVDDTGGGQPSNSRIHYVPRSDGVYIISAEGSNNTVGTFTLSVRAND